MTKSKAAPKAVREYIMETGETEAVAREYILRQIEFYESLEEKGPAQVEQWVGFKLGCSASSARPAINWALKG